jgi:hypothetical protein
MLAYQSPVLADQNWVEPIVRSAGYLGCDGAFGTMYVWRAAYRIQICRYGDFLLRSYGENAEVQSFPLGQGDLLAALNAMREDAQQRGHAFRLSGLTEEAAGRLQALMPGCFSFVEQRDAADYLYDSAALIALPGKKYHGKRNHISKFQRMYQWSYEDLCEENLEECRALAHEWCEQYGCSEENGLHHESCALREAFDHFSALEFQGGMLRVEGKPVAFTMGEALDDQTFIVHFEKALSQYTGAYTMINREFAAHRLGGYRYINREEDMGLEGLRKAKLSYHPAVLLMRYDAAWIQ